MVNYEKEFIEERACRILKKVYGENARFRPNQLEAIVAVVSGQNSLVIKKTGWGKSIVYFIATKILRENGAGPTLVISPLLALMKNQVEAAKKIGLNVVTINSDNKDRWIDIYENLDHVDALIIAPERLSNEKFLECLAGVSGIELVVVDEVHSISEWGHDFRPDYQRISKFLKGLPGAVTVLGTTATANKRVIDDIKDQIDGRLEIFRGNLIRENLAIQVNPSQSREIRLAWLAQMFVENEILSNGQGIIYCLTRSDCMAIADFLTEQGVSILPFYSGMGKDEQGNNIEEKNLESFENGKTRVIVATIKLGMGYDKSGIRFVVHFQLPPNLIAYYQQIGRAGRDGKPAYAFLLHGEEDEKILKYFIDSTQKPLNLCAEIINIAQSKVKFEELLSNFNVKEKVLDETVKYLLVHGYLNQDKFVYQTNLERCFDKEVEQKKQEQLIKTKCNEYKALLEYIKSTDCYMKCLAVELDAPDLQESCGICSNCQGDVIVPVSVKQRKISEATKYLAERHGVIKPREKWSSGSNIKPNLRMQTGWTLSADYYSEVGQKVKDCKYNKNEHFSNELVELSSKYLREKIVHNSIDFIVPIPSSSHPNLVSGFAESLASSLGISYIEAVVKKSCKTKEQKNLLNSVWQEKNIQNTMDVNKSPSIEGKSILLVDDMVDSRWTFTVVAAKLLEAGASSVYPFALVKTGSGD